MSMYLDCSISSSYSPSQCEINVEFHTILQRPVTISSTLHEFLKPRSMNSINRNTDRGLSGSDENNDSRHTLGTSDAPNSIESWLARRDQFRVVGVGHVRPLPLRVGMCTAQFASYYEEHIQSQVKPILKKHNINWSSIGLYKFIPDKALPETENLHSLQIQTKDENPDTWEKAAKELQEAFRRADIPSEQIEIEIHNLFKMKFNLSHAFEVEKAVLDEADAISPIISNDLQALCGGEWSSIGFYLRSSKFDDNATKHPTILVQFFHGAALDFDSIESHLLETLRGCKTSFKLELLSGPIRS